MVTYMYSGGSGLSIDIHFVDIELSYDVLSPLPIVLSKHFNHPHPYIETATAISDDTILHYICMSYCIAACNTEYFAADCGFDCGCDSPIVASGPSASKSVQSTSAGKRVEKGSRSQTNLKDGKLIIN